VNRFLGTVEEIAVLDPAKVVAVVDWITAIPFEDWGQQKPHGALPLKPAMMSNRTWHNFGETFDPLVNDILSEHYPGCIAQQAMLSVVMPGDHIPPHKDDQCPEWVERIHVPLTTNEQTSFVCDDGPHFLQVGKAYRVNTEATHAVYNYGKTPRVHFMFDVRT
jgi:hypothetical protein